MLLGIRWYQFVRNDDVRRLTKQRKLTAIIQSRRLTLFGHIMCMDDNADAKRILLDGAEPRDAGTTWLSSRSAGGEANRILLASALSSMRIICPNRVSRRDWIIAVSLGCFVSLVHHYSKQIGTI